MPDALTALRIVCLALWAIVALILLPSAWRFTHGRSFTDVDEYRTGFFFTALLMIGGIGRWLLMPNDDGVFAGIYALTAALGAYVLLLTRQGRTK